MSLLYVVNVVKRNVKGRHARHTYHRIPDLPLWNNKMSGRAAAAIGAVLLGGGAYYFGSK